MQRASAGVIPLPAGELSRFLYSSDAQGFIDLAPGMEIKIEELQMPTGPAVKVAPTQASDPQAAKVTESYGYLQTVRIDRGVALRRSKPETQLSAMRSDLYSDLRSASPQHHPCGFSSSRSCLMARPGAPCFPEPPACRGSMRPPS